MNRAWIRDRFRAKVRQPILARSGWLARACLHPNPLRKPARRQTLNVARDSGIGDVLMLTPALRELKRLNPALRLRFFTKFPDLVRGLPYLDEVLPYSELPAEHLFVEYTDIVPSNVHIAKLMGDRLGVNVSDVRPDCIVDQQLVESYREAWTRWPRPHSLILRRASRFTPNKDWPDASWTALIARLGASGTVIEIGDAVTGDEAAPGGNYVDMRGATSLPEMAAAVAAADIYVGPVSGPMHIAAAVGTPSVAIIGGYEHRLNAHYAGNTEFYTPLPCAPCWLREPCPFDLKCLRVITPEQVVRAVQQTWAGIEANEVQAA